jgi:hypothetical protein
MQDQDNIQPLFECLLGADVQGSPQDLRDSLRRAVTRVNKRIGQMTDKYSRSAFQKAYPDKDFPNEMQALLITWAPASKSCDQ